MTDTGLLEHTSTAPDPTDLDLDIQIVGIHPDAVVGSPLDSGRSTLSCGTSPSTYGVQSRCPYCCC